MIEKNVITRSKCRTNNALTYALGIMRCHEDISFIGGQEAIVVDVFQGGDTI